MTTDELGGKQVFESVVDNFYARVLLDMTLAPFFAGVPMAELRRHQVEFLSCILAGKEYQGKSMAEAHRHLAIEDQHFSRIAEHLNAALDSCHVAAAVKDKLLLSALNLRPDIVQKK
ncbi:MAG: group I truncated hemoglobin [Spirochaetota bacterium]